MTPTPPAPRPPAAAEPAVRLDVRLGGGRAVGYQMDGDEFRVGGAPGCDVQLPGKQSPPLVCRITRGPEGLRLRKLDPAFPLLVNGSPVTGPDPVPLHNGDRIAVGAADVTVSVGTTHLRPRFVPIAPPPPPALGSALGHPHHPLGTEAEEDPPAGSAALAAERAELAQLRARLEEQARELEADRALWYRRRQEVESEAGPREQALARREEELARAREELAGIRESLFDQYRERREQLAQMQEVVQGATASLEERQRRFEEESARRGEELDRRERQIEDRIRDAVAEEARRLEAEFADRLAAAESDVTRLREELAARGPADEREADLARREEQLEIDRESLRAERERYAEDLSRLDRWQAALDDRQRQLDRRAAEVDERHEQLRRDTLELEENVRLADAEQERLAAEAARLEKLRSDLDRDAERLARRSQELEAKQAAQAILRARLDRQYEDAQQEANRLVADRVRLEDAQRDLDARLREAERLRAELTSAREDQAEQQRLTAERTALLDATLAEIQQQKDALSAEQTRLWEKELELDARSAEIAEQAAVLKARVTQVMELQERLEADRTAVREREATLTDADSARQTFQEQLRRRAEELAARSKQLDEVARRHADERADLDRLRAELDAGREQADRTRGEWASRAAELDRRTAELADREGVQERQAAKLQEVGRAVAAARKEAEQLRRQAEAERAEVEAFRARAREEIEALRRDAPALEERARVAGERLAAARDVLRGHLAELHAYAAQTREELNALQSDLRDREQALEKARAEHRHAVAEFRQQLLDWQAKVAELKRTLARGESKLEARQAEVSVTTLELARQAEELRQEKQIVAERRAEVERHLSDMREWYRKKLRELAAARGGEAGRGGEVVRSRGSEEPGVLPLPTTPPPHHPTTPDDLDPGDRQLGELLRSLELVDADTLAALWEEARRQRRPLRRVLLASGAVTLYQLALIEAGNLDALMLGRFRVVDRVRVTPRESAYRVFDPDRGGTFLLRHLAEAEMDDAVRPDEFRQRFAAARDAAHPNLAATVEVLELNGRPAALQEWLTGPPSGEWTAEAALPGVWVKLLHAAASALDAAHRAGLVHGRLTSESFLLTPEGVLKVTGFGEPPWLAGGPAPGADPTPEADLRALGQAAFGWTLLGQPGGRRRKKAFPESLLAVIRRLEADAETPMADTAPGAVPYRTAGELAADLARLGRLFPCPPDAWERLAAHAAAHGTAAADPGLRQSA